MTSATSRVHATSYTSATKPEMAAAVIATRGEGKGGAAGARRRGGVPAGGDGKGGAHRGGRDADENEADRQPDDREGDGGVAVGVGGRKERLGGGERDRQEERAGGDAELERRVRAQIRGRRAAGRTGCPRAERQAAPQGGKHPAPR